ncbi:MAG: septum site-determining protein MinC [Chloroflexi bacterium OLB15]|nr:MAG: septum site-determining protein MinC [Chloroflexi bacterium OLB15]
MPDSTVAIKGVNDGLLITLDSVEEWGMVTANLAAHIDEKGEFFSGAAVTLEVGARPVRKDELSSVKALLERRGMTLFAVSSESDTTLESAIALDLRVRANNQPQIGSAYEPDTPTFNSEEDGTIGVMIRRTMRSGRSVHSQGHVVIYGDVNAGAEILAAGDVIVWGKLRGIVHAGADGDETAVVCALDMQPTQLRIAGYIAISPPEKRRKPKPEVALIRNDRIVVEDWDG